MHSHPSAQPLTSPPPAPIPGPVAWLGYGGLLPFVTLAAVGLLAPTTPWWSAALLAYGAVILSFVGALHWGFAMAQSGLSTAERTRCFVWSVVPSLMAWPATLLPPSGRGSAAGDRLCGAPGARPSAGRTHIAAGVVPAAALAPDNHGLRVPGRWRHGRQPLTIRWPSKKPAEAGFLSTVVSLNGNATGAPCADRLRGR